MKATSDYRWGRPRKAHRQPTPKEKVQALLILFSIVAMLVGACIWFFGFYSPALDEPKAELPPFEPPKPAAADDAKP
jgi:hypothetical protein